MEAAYRQGLPHRIRVVGEDAVWHDGAVRPLLHPDPRCGAVECRIVEEAPAVLAGAGYSRLTLVLRETRRLAGTFRGCRPRRQASHLTVVPQPPNPDRAPPAFRSPTAPRSAGRRAGPGAVTPAVPLLILRSLPRSPSPARSGDYPRWLWLLTCAVSQPGRGRASRSAAGLRRSGVREKGWRCHAAA